MEKYLSGLTIEQVAIGELRPDLLNPRRLSHQELLALERSIEEFGLVDPIIVRRADKMVIGGHQRLQAAQRLGMSMVPSVLLDISPERARLLSLALNRIHGDWDEALLGRLLSDLGDVPNMELSLSGFTDDEIAGLVKSIETKEQRDRPEDFDFDMALEAASKRCHIERGQLWQLGEHRLLCGDATSEEDVALLLAGCSAEMAFTDPPYGVHLGDHGGAMRNGRRRRVANDALVGEALEEFVRLWAKQLLRSVNGAIYVTMSTQAWPLVSAILEEFGGHWSDTLIWAKDRFVLGRADYQRQYEPIWYGWRDGVKRQWHGGRKQGDILQVARPSRSDVHPTMKPLELVERALENSSQPGDRVADLFLGSGSTLISAERTGRICLGLELEPKYCFVTIARWEAFTGRKAVLLDG